MTFSASTASPLGLADAVRLALSVGRAVNCLGNVRRLTREERRRVDGGEKTRRAAWMRLRRVLWCAVVRLHDGETINRTK
jgi:hypothetical protein